MALSISDMFRAKMKSTKDPRMFEEASADYAYPTGFLSFDYMNGTVVHVKKGDMQFQYTYKLFSIYFLIIYNFLLDKKMNL